MGWTAIPTFTARQQQTPTIWNTYLKDNIDFLKALPLVQDYDTGESTTSLGFATTSLTGSLTTYGGNVLMRMTGQFQNLGVNVLNGFDFCVDGVSVMGGNTWNFTTPAGSVRAWCEAFFVTSTPPSAGVHTYAVYWKTASSTLTRYQGRFYTVELL